MKQLIVAFLILGSLALASCGGKSSSVNEPAYNRIMAGMSKAEVETMLGEKQTKIWSSTETDTTYRWWDGDGYTIYVTFEKGVVKSKKESNLDEKE